ncbi:MAG TPA: class I SAM-dependent methyltransferase [Pyrinomonadaceae bacterium]|jgi:SAM-dependent methyltransferase
MTDVFNDNYSSAYDLIYGEKDYAGECDLIERLFQTYGGPPVRSILDLGCGTGGHAHLLGQRGYSVVGVDRSESMLAHAGNKIDNISLNGRVQFQQGDVRSVELERQFCAVLMMFAVLGYQSGNEDVLAALKTARRHLGIGGLLLFDIWHGPAVLHERPGERVKVVSTPTGQILRNARGELDTRRHLCHVRYQVWRLEEGRSLEYAEERHAMRYFFPLELELFLRSSGFAMLRLGAFPEFAREPDETTWNVLCVAKAI